MTEEIVKRKPADKPSALAIMANRMNVEPDKLFATLKATVFKGATNEELLTLVVIANEHDLNPLLKEIHGFSKGRDGGVQPVVGVDGWIKIINRQPKLDGIEFDDIDDEDGNPIKKVCTIWVKGRKKPVIVGERFKECFRPTDPWKTMPHRMLRHKALMQCGRYAFGISGIQDEDEARDTTRSAMAVETVPKFDIPKTEVPTLRSELVKENEAPKPNGPIQTLRMRLLEHDLEEKVFCGALNLLGYDLGDIYSLDELNESHPHVIKQLVTQDMGKILDEMEAKAPK